ncbi:MAG TPA: PKD domain-containing protein, partial [Flavobacteriales bacterium]|nr:PKD domain-containing protein [Flavobacteriales bacterium]
MKKYLLLLSFCIIGFGNYATHIVGGSLTYDHLGGSSYRINLRLYRAADLCDPHVALQTTARVDIYFGSSGAFYQSVTVNRIELSVVQPYIDSCAANPACTEIEQGIFTAVVNTMPPIAGGYHLYFETCCRNSAVQNLVNPGASGPGNGGEGFYVKVPDNTLLLTNSSPQWKQPPPVFICQGFDIDFDHGATDVDGDSLVYSFYNPFSDYDYTSPAPWDITFTAGVPNFVYCNFIAPFSPTNPLDISGATSLTVDVDGVIHGIPPDLGRFAAGIQCDEYRDGVKIGSIYRDFQFNVVYCPPPIQPIIGESSSCDGDYTVTFSNESLYDPSTTFFWDFDISLPNTTPSDTSNATNPTYNYPAVYQCYDVMLVTQPHTKCADTTYKTICVDQAIADYNAVDSVCINTAVNFTDNSSGSPSNPVTSWNWDFDDGGTSVIPSPTHTFTSPGTFNVQLAINTSVGCKDTVIQPFFVQGQPTANGGPDLNSCLNNPTVTLNGSVTNASGGLWVNWAPGGVFTPPSPSNLVVDYTPAPSEIAAGSMYIILTTTGNG